EVLAASGSVVTPKSSDRASSSHTTRPRRVSVVYFAPASSAEEGLRASAVVVALLAASSPSAPSTNVRAASRDRVASRGIISARLWATRIERDGGAFLGGLAGDDQLERDLLARRVATFKPHGPPVLLFHVPHGHRRAVGIGLDQRHDRRVRRSGRLRAGLHRV